MILRSAVYSGPRHNFSFSSYYDHYSQAHMKLLQVRKHMTVEQQIDTFVQGFQCVTARSIVVNLAGDPAIWTAFEVYYNAVASTLELLLPLTHTPTNRESRNVNELGSGKCKAPYKGRNPRDPKLRKIPRKSDINKNFIPENKGYPLHIWKSLTFVNKEKVRSLSRSHNQNSGGRQRNVGPHSVHPQSM